MKLVLICLLILITSSSYGQGNSKTVTYFDKEWQPVKKASDAFYYRTVEQQQNKYLVKDFYKATDTLQMEAVCSKVTPAIVQDGPATFYHKNGQRERTGLYQAGLPVGVHRVYYSNGNPHSVNVFREKDMLVAEYWSPQGQPMLMKGTGLITEKNEYVPGTMYIEVKDSVQLRAFHVNVSDTVYTQTQTPAEYRGGMEAFYKGIGKTIKYPAAARRNGVEGRVFVQFMIEQNGALSNAKVLKGIGAGCDEEAVRACLTQKDWQPGKYNGKTIKTLMVLPVAFRLR